jgi:hypothetical protein
MIKTCLKHSGACAAKASVRRLRQQSLSSSYVSVEGLNIHIVREGHGPHPLLLLPGALGSATSDFYPQLAGLSQECWESEVKAADVLSFFIYCNLIYFDTFFICSSILKVSFGIGLSCKLPIFTFNQKFQSR